MKKFLLLALVVCLAVALVACKQPDNTPACTDHVDDNYDGVCDNDGCGGEVTGAPLFSIDSSAANTTRCPATESKIEVHDGEVCSFLTYLTKSSTSAWSPPP